MISTEWKSRVYYKTLLASFHQQTEDSVFFSLSTYTGLHKQGKILYLAQEATLGPTGSYG